jgi:lipoprotein-releasing system permease protein
MADATSTDTTTDTKAFAPFEWMLAMRYLRARRKEGFISVIAGFSFLGILLGVATLIIVMAVMNGFRNQLFEKILGLNGHAVVYKLASVGPFDDYDQLAKRLTAIPGVKSAVPLIEGQVMVSSPMNAAGGLVRGMTEQGIRTLPLVANNVLLGSIKDFDTQDGVAVGTRLAQSLGLKIGDNLTLISPRGADTPFGRTPRSKPYRIAAIFEMGMSEYDRTMVFMPLGEAKRFFNRDNTVDVLEVHVADAQGIEGFIKAMETEAGEAFAFSSWKQRNASFFTVLEVERTVMFIILSLIILVAALNIVSGMMMLVKDKSRDIAVLRTMGATKASMMRVFLITGASIGVVGTFAGLIVGILFCWRIEQIRQFVQWVTSTSLMDPSVYYLTKLPADINLKETAGIVIMALVISVLATLYPSYRASKLDPVEALRYE